MHCFDLTGLTPNEHNVKFSKNYENLLSKKRDF